jgi:hypothetical protein
MQASLVTTYFISQYVVILTLILLTSARAIDDLNSFADTVNTLFRQQQQLFGRVVFLSVYVLLLAFSYLPPSLSDNDKFAALATNYVLSEEELELMKKARKTAIAKLKQLNFFIDYKSDIFCVNRAIDLIDLSIEAYYDPDKLTSFSSSGPMNLTPLGYTLIDYIYEEQHETFCYIAKHDHSSTIVVSFRSFITYAVNYTHIHMPIHIYLCVYYNYFTYINIHLEEVRV